MQTKYWKVSSAADEAQTDAKDIQEAAALLAQGKVVAFPTETVYGLGADARSDVAVEQIFMAKGRPADNPLIVHIASQEQLSSFVAWIPQEAQRLMEHFWPGPLTLVLPVKSGALSERVTAGLQTVAVRMPDHPLALELIREAGCPVAAPSANLSGRPSPTEAAHVWEDLNGRIAGILDGGASGIGLESTVVECTADGLNVLRPGGISLEQLREVVSHVQLDKGAAIDTSIGSMDAPRSPGMKYTHYAPQGKLIVVKGEDAGEVQERIQQELSLAASRGEKTGLLTFEERLADYQADVSLSYGGLGDAMAAAQQLYRVLREFDHQGATFIVAEGLPLEGLGFAIMNRLAKAAGGAVIQLDRTN